MVKENKTLFHVFQLFRHDRKIERCQVLLNRNHRMLLNVILFSDTFFDIFAGIYNPVQKVLTKLRNDAKLDKTKKL